ncbi:hypothetical protein TIFTF001_051668 [Ficus carica]|uniref:Uncharacterized protein n=1 Tax=Ficus carica TaxID=3494 RepID=A0AA87ZK72_FICCA|nr:hypothetical protein TIFTF001_051668 [Ficus carica]
MPWAQKTFARTDAPREATCSTSEPICQLAWQDGWSSASLRQDNSISILLLAFARFPTHSIELQPLLGSARKHLDRSTTVLWLMPPRALIPYSIAGSSSEQPLRMREANDRIG